MILGTGAAALAGLIIVAASVRADRIMAVPHWRLLAGNTTMSMITIMIGSILVQLPQTPSALGAELMTLNLVCGILLPGRVIVYVLRKRADLSLHVPAIAALLYALAGAGGLSLLLHRGGGMYLTTAAYLAYLPLGVLNAYKLLLPKF